jgi:adenylate cyclase
MNILCRASVLCLIFLLCSSPVVRADDPEKVNPKIDSMLQLVKLHPSDSIGAKTYINLAGEFLFDDPATCELYCYRSLKVARDAHWNSGIGEALGWIAYLLEQRGKVDSALIYYQQSLELAVAVNDKKGQGTILNNIAAIYKDKGLTEKALEMYARSLALKDSTNDVHGIATTYNNIGLIYQNQGQIDQALYFYNLSMHLDDSIGNIEGLGTSYLNLSTLYQEQGEYAEAMKYADSALAMGIKIRDVYSQGYAHAVIGRLYKLIGDREQAMEHYRQSFDLRVSIDDQQGMAYCLKYIGELYDSEDSTKMATSCFSQSLSLFTAMDDSWGMAQMQYLLGSTFYKNGELDSAREMGELSLMNAQLLGYPTNIRDAAKLLTDVYRSLGNYKVALEMSDLYVQMRDSVVNDETKKIALLNKFQSDYDKKAAVLQAQTNARISEERVQRNTFIGGFILVLLLAIVLFSRYRIKTAANKELNEKNLIISNEKERSDKLLLNILPQYVANELKETGAAKATSYESATVMFTDFVDFTKSAEQLSPEDLVREINFCFSEFDSIIGKYKIEKVKTIGDAYMCAGGIPQGYEGHPAEIIKAALEIRDFMIHLGEERAKSGENCFRIRIGIATGPLVAGVVGIKKFAYDIWGDTVNVASRMESNSEPGKVNISQSTFEQVKDQFACTYRGEIEAKNKGKVKMYFVEKQNS